MGTPSVTNILKTGAIVWYAPYGEAIPDETTVAGAASWGGNWARIGYTAAPLIQNHEDERMLIEVEEELWALDEHRTKAGGMLTTELSEITADYYALLFGGTVSTTVAGASQKGFEQLDINPTSLITKYALGFEGLYQIADGSTQPIRVFAEKATFKINGDTEWSQKTDTYSKIPIAMRVLKGTNYPLRFQRITAAATS